LTSNKRSPVSFRTENVLVSPIKAFIDIASENDSFLKVGKYDVKDYKTPPPARREKEVSAEQQGAWLNLGAFYNRVGILQPLCLVR